MLNISSDTTFFCFLKQPQKYISINTYIKVVSLYLVVAAEASFDVPQAIVMNDLLCSLVCHLVHLCLHFVVLSVLPVPLILK